MLSPPAHWLNPTPVAKTTGCSLEGECGAMAIEYGLIVSLIAVAVAGVIGVVAVSLTATFDIIAAKLCWTVCVLVQ
jgi:Flp pilus assembly pilin Flp